MPIQGFLEGEANNVQFVGAKDTETKYKGPVAQVSFDEKWLHITTDDYEGSAMLNIESLPYLLTALERIVALQTKAKS